MEDEEEYKKGRYYALKRLSLQPILSHKLASFLKERDISEGVVERLIKELTDLGLINDEEWIQSFMRHQLRKKMGPLAIVQKLANKGVRGVFVKESVAEKWTPQEQKTLIKELLKTRYQKYNLKDFKERNKVVASLSRRGFELSYIFESVNINLEKSDQDFFFDL